MWSNFFAAGGWGMYPTSILGFFLLASCALYAIRPEQRTARLALVLGLLTFASGLLGTATGISNSAHYIEKVAKPDQLEIFALGIEESLHVVILSLLLAVLGGLIAIGGALRQTDAPKPAKA